MCIVLLWLKLLFPRFYLFRRLSFNASIFGKEVPFFYTSNRETIDTLSSMMFTCALRIINVVYKSVFYVPKMIACLFLDLSTRTINRCASGELFPLSEFLLNEWPCTNRWVQIICFVCYLLNTIFSFVLPCCIIHFPDTSRRFQEFPIRTERSEWESSKAPYRL